MVSVWMIIGLVLAAVSVSALGAAFSVVGLGALFSGATIAVAAMAIALEFAKFVLAAYLHQRWAHLKVVFKYYLTTAIVILSCITSMGIFGFLSDAYQSATVQLDAETIKLNALTAEKNRIQSEIGRLNRSVDEIPANRITKRLQVRAEIEPAIAALIKQTDGVENRITAANLQIVDIKKRIGPLVYIAKAFNQDIDTIVKYLILVFIFVFDPLAICLVIATSDAFRSRQLASVQKNSTQSSPSVPPFVAAPSDQTNSDQVIEMRFVDDSKRTG